MPVAPLYKKYKILGQPYAIEDKRYVDINYNGFPKRVQWYSNAEYALLTRKKHTAEEIYAKHGFSYDKKSIIILGDVYNRKEELKTLGCIFSAGMRWHLPYNAANEANIHNLGFQYKIIEWEDILDESGVILDDDALLDKLHNEKISQWQGHLGNRLTRIMKVKDYSRTGGYPFTFIYTFVDQFHNEFTCKHTVALGTGQSYIVSGVVSDHIYANGTDKVTLLTLCHFKEVVK